MPGQDNMSGHHADTRLAVHTGVHLCSRLAQSAPGQYVCFLDPKQPYPHSIRILLTNILSHLRLLAAGAEPVAGSDTDSGVSSGSKKNRCVRRLAEDVATWIAAPLFN